MLQRLQKMIAASGLTSRRKAEQLLVEGRVQVNGRTAALGDLADETRDQILVDGQPLQSRPRACYVMLHKPRGYVTTLSDERGRKTVQDLLADYPERVYPVGRLDQYSEGLLLLTNDGDLAQRLMHPSAQISKTYLVWVSGCSAEALEKIKRRIEIDGRKIAKPDVCCLWQRDGSAQLQITIHEGRNRQIRRMCQAAGMHANRLKRIREGSLELGSLPVGAWRELTETEVKQLKQE